MRVRTILTLCAAPLLTAGLIAPSVLTGTPAGAQTSPNPSSADAYGVLVAARLLQGNVPVDVGPLVESSSTNPPGGPNSASLVPVPAIPADGSIVQSLGVVQTSTNADGTPQSTATAETANAKLLPTAGVPQISADVIKAQSNTDCGPNTPNANGTQFVNLKVGPVVVPVNPQPNTTIQLGLLTVIVNEQHPTADGRGLVVNGIHIVAPGTLNGTPVPTQALLQGDIIISHAVSTVVCPAGGPGSTAKKTTTPIEITKTANPSTVSAGGSVTYTASITNSGPSQCLVNELIDHLPVGFSPVSTDGPLGAKESTSTRPDKGIDVTVVPATSVIIAPGATLSGQHFVVTASSTPGTYANNLELLCSDLGDFEMTGAPVTVTAAPAATPTSGTTNNGASATPAPNELPHTGGPSPLVPIGGAVILAGGLAVAARRRRLHS